MNERLWGILIDAFPKLLMYGIEVTVPLTILSFALALIISVIVALIQYADVKVLRQICRFYIWIVRGTPLLVQLYLVFYGLPSLGIVLDAFPTAVLVFGLNEGAYMAESVRGALEAVPKGGLPHRLPRPFQLPHLYGEGHVAGGLHYGDGDVPSGPGHQRPGL